MPSSLRAIRQYSAVCAGSPALLIRSPQTTTKAGRRRLAFAIANSKFAVSCAKSRSFAYIPNCGSDICRKKNRSARRNPAANRRAAIKSVLLGSESWPIWFTRFALPRNIMILCIRCLRLLRNPLRKYNGRLFLGDFFGGAIAALIALPYGLAMASLMGLPPILGLYTSLLAAPICALLGRNPVLIGGTSSATVPFILGSVRAGGISGAAKICIFASIFLMIFCVLRLGRYVSKVPQTVLAGFSCGIGGLMVISQLKVIFGLKVPPGGWSTSMAGQLIQSLEQFRQFHWMPAVVAGIVMLISTLVRMRFPRAGGLWHRQPDRWILRGAHQRRYPGQKRRQCPMRRDDENVKCNPRRTLVGHDDPGGVGDFTSPPGRARRRDRLDGLAPARLEHLETPAQDAPRGCGRVYRDSLGRADRGCRP